MFAMRKSVHMQYTLALLGFLVCLLTMPPVALADNAEDEQEFTPEQYEAGLEAYRLSGVSIALTDDFEPFSFVDKNGAPAGLAVDIWRLWGEKIGIPIRFAVMDSSESLEAMKRGEADFHGGLYHAAEREEFFDFSRSYYDSAVVLALSDKSDYDCYNVREEGELAVVDKSYTHEWALSRLEEARIITCQTMSQVARAVVQGDVDAAVADYSSLVEQVGGVDQLNGLSICRTLFFKRMYAGVRKGDSILLQIVNEGLGQISVEEMEELKKPWVVVVERSLPWQWAVMPAAIAIVLLFVAVGLWLRRKPFSN